MSATKKRSKSTRRKTRQAKPLPSPKSTAPDDIPAFLKRFDGKSQKQVVSELIPIPPGNEQADNVVAGLFSALFDTGITVPEWAKRASQKMLEGMGFDFLGTKQPDAETPEFSKVVGKITGLTEEMLKEAAPPGSAMGKIKNELLAPFVDYTKTVASKAEPVHSAAFFNGRMETPKLLEIMQNLPQRSKIYAIIAGGWQEIQKFKSTGELHKWILSKNGQGGKWFIAPQTDSREIRKVCLSVGLKFQNSWQKIKNAPVATASEGGIIALAPSEQSPFTKSRKRTTGAN